MLRRLLHALAGFVLGLVAGLVVTLGLVVARARLEGVYLHGMGELVGWISLPVLVLPVVGAWLAVSEGRALRPAAIGVATGLLLGGALGAAAGSLLSADPAWAWAGGIMGSAAGLLTGFIVGVIRSTPTSRPALVVPLLLAATGACTESRPPLPQNEEYEEPAPDEVEAVVYFLGDPGEARLDTHPVLAAMRRDVERWAGRLGGERRVAMVVLGDIVYPDGVDARESSSWQQDSATVADQVAIVAGEAARRHGALGLFVAGNHDWGEQGDWSGAVRLHRLAGVLGGWRARGVGVSLEPPPGTGGPSVVDLGEGLRLILLDTAWWLYEGTPPAMDSVVVGVERALADAGGRRTVIAAHHPFRSGGPHGNLTTFGNTLGLRTLLSRSGTLLQDLHSQPYRALVMRLEAVFRERGPPAVFAGGHEHSLQVIGRVEESEPAVSLVVGSASKLTDVEPVSGTLVSYPAPGYARLFVLEGGRLRLSVEAVPPSFLSCPSEDPDRATCMERALAAFRTVWAGDL